VPAAGRIRIAPTAVAVAVAAGAALGLSACGGSSHQRSSTPTVAISAQTSGSAASLQQDFVSVIARDSPEVVQIENPHGLGSGIVFDGRGDIVTNAHVVAGGGPYQVTDSHGRKYSARLVGAFTPDDLAVVHVSGGSLHPLGLRSSVTNGIVSAVGRTVGEPNGVVLPNVIQTSAPINPGNSGGALVNLQGQVVGIPTLAATDPQLGGGAAPGIGFAIPSSVVSDIAGQIVAHGHVVNSHRAYLGVELAAVSSGGAVVVAVKRGGAAARAGIRPGDVITAIDKHAVPGPEAAAEVLATLSPGARVPVSLLTPGGRRRTVSVKLGQYP
jgi:putative serine protease PepD